MDTALFAQMLSDRHGTNLRKLRAKYPQADIQAFLSWLKSDVYRSVPLQDDHGENLVYLDRAAAVPASAVEALRAPQACSQPYCLQAMEEEILSTFAIENISCSRDSVRSVLAGNVPCNMEEERICGMQKALNFIADRSHTITEENLFHLYETAIAPFLPAQDKLLPGDRYRHDAVYIVGAQVEHTGIPWDKLPAHMGNLVAFSNVNDPIWTTSPNPRCSTSTSPTCTPISTATAEWRGCCTCGIWYSGAISPRCPFPSPHPSAAPAPHTTALSP